MHLLGIRQSQSSAMYQQPPHSSGPYRSADPYGGQQQQAPSSQGGAPRSNPGQASYAPAYSAYPPPSSQQGLPPRAEPYTIFNPAQAAARPTAAGGGGYQQQQGGGAPYSGHPPAQGPMSEFVGYDAFTSVSNSQAVRFGMNMGQQVINENVKRYVPWLTGTWQSLKYYFAVNHGYVYKKLLTLLFPFRKRQWSRSVWQRGPAYRQWCFTMAAVVPVPLLSLREVKDDGSAENDGFGVKYQLPMLDDNAPDLYIPLMAFITYVLVTGYAKGTRSSFTPEVLVQVTSSCMVAQILEIAIICLGLYMLQAPVNLLDLMAFTGYKYVALNINMILGITMGTAVYTVAMLYTGLAVSYFVLKSIAQAVKRGYQAQSSGPIRAEFIVLGFAILQFISVWWLGYAGDLKKAV